MCYWIWDKGNPREAHGIARVRELTMMWDRANSNWVKHILPGLTYNSSLVRTFCFYPHHLHHATDFSLFNWMFEAWLSPAIPCSSFPKHEDGNHPISTEQSQAEHQPTKNCCANRNVEVVEGCAEPAFYSPSYHSWSHCWLNPTMAPLQSILFPHLHGFQSKSRQIKMPHQTIHQLWCRLLQRAFS